MTISDERNNINRSELAPEICTQIMNKLKGLIEVKFYTNTELTLHSVSNLIGTNTRYLSQIINVNFGCSFPKFINQLRIEEAQKLLKNPEHDNLTLHVLGEYAGFKSRTTFITVFKETTGLTPSVYKKQLREI